MFKVGEYVVYKRNVCSIKELKDINSKKYYILVPIDDKTLTISVPVDADKNLLRGIISKEESEKLIKSIPNIEVININDKLIENEYKKLISTGKLEDLVKIIKTTYNRNYERISNKKKIGEKDDNYFRKAENLLYNELSISLGKSYEDTKKYVIDKVKAIMDEKN